MEGLATGRAYDIPDVDRVEEVPCGPFDGGNRLSVVRDSSAFNGWEKSRVGDFRHPNVFWIR